jgi:hypothetical protein
MSAAEQEVTLAALRRAAALADRDEAALRQLMHPDLQWTNFRGEVLGYQQYITGNTGGDLRWRSQRLTQVWVRTPDGWRCLAGHASRPDR